MKIKNEDDLDNYIICHKCFTLHKIIPIKDGYMASCNECGAMLYRYDTKLVDKSLALSISGLIFFILANFFPIVKIEILGHNQFITISKTIFTLMDSGFYIVGTLCMFLIFIFPLMILIIDIILFTLLKLRRSKKFTKTLLVLLAHILPWSMPDIFLISILVALVKLIGYVQIDMGMAFYALIIFVLIDIYIVKKVKISELWILRENMILKRSKN